ncbi:TonB-dependent receptor [Chloroherpeton thalassium]|uniref:TonB-dependent receptor n=1 Tax=Chloroherpeton thalassium TaxID=100716 RepID=UPI0012FC2662|nr:TonB-dependent receptor [Chloroherpeton thalassium]
MTSKHTHNKFEEITEKSSVLEGQALQKELSQSLAATLKNETGLAMRSMGPAPSRPVIRGLGSDRVLISEDGNRTTDLSSTSPDHAVTVDPFTIERLEVIRGPKVLLQSPTTIGGVINAVRHEIPQELRETVSGTLGAYGETANSGYLTAATLEVPLNPFMIRGEISRRKTGDISTPIGTLGNSESENLNYSVGGSYIWDYGFVGASMRDFNLDYGIPGGFVGAHPNGVSIEMQKQVRNVKSRINLNMERLENIEIHLTNSYYRHKELESNNSVGADFRIRNNYGFVNLNHLALGFLEKGTVGFWMDSRDFDIGGNVFTPSSKSLHLAGYVYESFTLNRVNLEFAARYNFDNIRPDAEDPDSRIGNIRERTFHTYSLSFSALYQLTETFSFGGNLSKSSRVPTIEELYSEGPHLAAYSYEVGNPDLDAESGVGSELFMYYKSASVYVLGTAFLNYLSSYIIPRNTGETNWRLILPVYQTYGVDALFFGSEFDLEWYLSPKWTFQTSASYTNGSFASSGKPLPWIPPLKGKVGISYSNAPITLNLNTEWAANQYRVDEFEDPTDGYAILNASALYALTLGKQVHHFSLSADNIFDTEYRNHLSRVKSIMPEAGRNFRFTYKMFF